MRCYSLRMLEKKVLCFYSQFPDWLFHFQELDSMLGTKFLQKGCWILQRILMIKERKRKNKKPIRI